MNKEIIVAVLGSGAFFTAIFSFVQFFINRHDKKNDKIAELSKMLTDRLDNIEKVQKCLLKSSLYQMIDRHKTLGQKTQAEDFDFNYMMDLYISAGNGNSNSMMEQWKDIPFIDER